MWVMGLGNSKKSTMRSTSNTDINPGENPKPLKKYQLKSKLNLRLDSTQKDNFNKRRKISDENNNVVG